MDWGSIIGGIGIGSIAGSVLTQYFNAKEKQVERIFNKKESAYIGLLDALYLADIEHNSKNAKNYGNWHNKVSLVGSPDVVKFSQAIIDTFPGSAERKNALDSLIEAMRSDLKIDKRVVQ